MISPTTGPEKKYGKKIANLLRAFAKEVQEESKANGVKVSCEFVYWGDKSGKTGKTGGELKMVTHVTPDAVTERLDGALKPRGNKLQLDVDHALQAQVDRLRRKT